MAEDFRDVINTIIGEAGGEGRKGQIATAYTILNRAAKKGISPSEVVRESKQFSGYYAPGPAARRAQQDPKVRAAVEKVWNEVLSGSVPDPTHGGTMFHASNITPYWASDENKHGTVRIGKQTYYLGSGARNNSALSAIDAAAPTPQTADLGTLRQAYAPLPQTAEGLNVRPVTSVAIDPSTGMPASSLTSSSSSAPTPLPQTDAMIARTMAALPQGRGASIIPTPPSMMEPRNLATPILQGNGQVIDPAALTLWGDGQPSIMAGGFGSLTPAQGRSAAPTAETAMAPSRPFSAPPPVPRAPSSFDKKYGDLVDLIRPAPVPQPAGSLQRQVAYENAGTPAPRAIPAPPTVAQLQAMRAVPESLAPVPATMGTNTIVSRSTSPVDPALQAALNARVSAPPSVPLPPPQTQVAMNGVGTMPGLGELNDFTSPPNGTALVFKTNTDRLPPNNFVDPPQQTAVATQLDVVPPPLPRARPAMAPMTPASAIPLPAPRLNRPTSFFPGVQLPGVLGGIQGLSQAMNNASGTFNNGADNLLQQAFTGSRPQPMAGRIIYTPESGRQVIGERRNNSSRGEHISQNSWFNEVTGR